MEKKEYTLEEQVAYWREKAKGGKKEWKKAKKEGKNDPNAPKRSGCVLVPDYKYTGKNAGIVGPMLYGWRISRRFGFQTFRAYLSKDGGKPQNGKGNEDKCLVFVVNMRVDGLGKLPAQTGVWSLQHKKLSITDAALVANPHANRGGYFGKGGERYKKQATS